MKNCEGLPTGTEKTGREGNVGPAQYWPSTNPEAASTGSASNVTGGSHGSTGRDLSDTATVPCFE